MSTLEFYFALQKKGMCGEFQIVMTEVRAVLVAMAQMQSWLKGTKLILIKVEAYLNIKRDLL